MQHLAPPSAVLRMRKLTAFSRQFPVIQTLAIYGGPPFVQ
jgi:hypothetical protein